MRAPLTTAMILTCLVALMSPASPAAAASASATAEVSQRVDAPQAGDDFPQLPPRCRNRERLPRSPCRLTSYPGRPWAVLWGDSHAWMYLPAVRAVAKKQRVNLVVILFGSCPVSVPLPPQEGGAGRTGCEKHNVESLRYVRELDSRTANLKLLIGGFWSGYRQADRLMQQEEATGRSSGLSAYQERMATLADYGTPRMFKRFARLRLDVDVLAPAASVPKHPGACKAGRDPYQCNLPRRRALEGEVKDRRWLEDAMRPLITPRLIDPSPVYCDRATCYAHVNGINTFYDDIHLGAKLTSTMRRYFVPSFTDLD